MCLKALRLQNQTFLVYKLRKKYMQYISSICAHFPMLYIFIDPASTETYSTTASFRSVQHKKLIILTSKIGTKKAKQTPEDNTGKCSGHRTALNIFDKINNLSNRNYTMLSGVCITDQMGTNSSLLEFTYTLKPKLICYILDGVGNCQNPCDHFLFPL